MCPKSGTSRKCISVKDVKLTKNTQQGCLGRNRLDNLRMMQKQLTWNQPHDEYFFRPGRQWGILPVFRLLGWRRWSRTGFEPSTPFAPKLWNFGVTARKSDPICTRQILFKMVPDSSLVLLMKNGLYMIPWEYLMIWVLLKLSWVAVVARSGHHLVWMISKINVVTD